MSPPFWFCCSCFPLLGLGAWKRFPAEVIGDPAGHRAGGQAARTPVPPPCPHTTHPFHFMGLARLGRAWDHPSPTGTLRWPPASVSPPAQYAHTQLCQNQTFSQRAEGPPPHSHCSGLDGQWAPRPSWAPARSSSPSWLCPPGPGPPELSPGPGLWRAQVSAPVITRKVELAPLPR